MLDYKELVFSLMDDISSLKAHIENIEFKAEKMVHFIEDEKSGQKNVYYPRRKPGRDLYQ